MNRHIGAAAAAALLTILLISPSAFARDNKASAWAENMKDLDRRIWVVDGTTVHNVGNLQMHVCNWGCFG